MKLEDVLYKVGEDLVVQGVNLLNKGDILGAFHCFEKAKTSLPHHVLVLQYHALCATSLALDCKEDSPEQKHYLEISLSDLRSTIDSLSKCIS